MAYCEDYPACGHTPLDPCDRQWYDEPDAFDPAVNPHCFCEHEYGICEVDQFGDEPDIDPADCDHSQNWSGNDDGTVTCDDCYTDGRVLSYDENGWIDKIEWEG